MGSKRRGIKARGFTLIELLIAIAIVAILAAVAVPSYLGHLRAAEFNSTVAAAKELKTPVSQCIMKIKEAKNCVSGKHDIPAAVVASPGVPGVAVISGVITATAPSDADYGVANATYILTPTSYQAGQPVTFMPSGTGCEKDYVDCE